MRPIQVLRMAAGHGPAGPVDPYFANVGALLHLDGANGSTSFPDQKGKVWTPSGGAAISTTQSKFGGASYASGAGKRIETPAHADLQLVGGLFTIEAWIYPTSSVGDQMIVCQDNGASGSVGFQFRTSGGVLQFVGWAGIARGSAWILSGGAVALNTWQKVEAGFDGTTTRLFNQGALGGSTANTYWGVASYATAVGNLTAGSFDNAFAGYIDEVRLTKGVCRNASAYTPETTAFPDS